MAAASSPIVPATSRPPLIGVGDLVVVLDERDDRSPGSDTAGRRAADGGGGVPPISETRGDRLGQLGGAPEVPQ
jgi:hypothetical protein